MDRIPESELVVNPDGSIFHLKLLPEQVPDNVILVGDSGRVPWVCDQLEGSEKLTSNREFTSARGWFNSQPVLVLSTGIGTDNMDIVVNELDALVNINLQTRMVSPERRSLRMVRIGTSGALQPAIPVGTAVASRWSLGLDGLLHYYRRPDDPERIALEKDMKEYILWPGTLPPLYGTRCGDEYPALLADQFQWGITVAAHGFYGPQGRSLRARLAHQGLNEELARYSFRGVPVSNFEMESSALYGLSEILGHSALTVCLIIANRIRKEFMSDYQEAMKKMIGALLKKIII